METNYIQEDVAGGVPLKMWTRGVPVEDEAKRQLRNAARLSIVHHHIAAMPDVHFGIGATVGSVIPTLKAIIPAAVGVDIGCGMMAVRTSLRASDLPESLHGLHGDTLGERQLVAVDRCRVDVDPADAEADPGRAQAVREREDRSLAAARDDDAVHLDAVDERLDDCLTRPRLG